MHRKLKPPCNIERISELSKEKFFKFLGFRMDEHLTWKYHIEHVKNKMSSANYALAITKKQFPLRVKKLMYHALAQSHIEYGLPIWYNEKAKQVISKIQKKLIRNLCNAKYNEHCTPLLAKSNILSPTDLHELAVIRLIKKARMGKAPQRIRDIFKTEDNFRPQRYPNNIRLNYNMHSSKVGYTMPKIWNRLSEELKDDDSSIKKTLTKTKCNFLQKYSQFTCKKTRTSSVHKCEQWEREKGERKRKGEEKVR